jgi:hypothetical protein
MNIINYKLRGTNYLFTFFLDERTRKTRLVIEAYTNAFVSEWFVISILVNR